MTRTVTLYYPIHAPDGQPFFTESGPLSAYVDEGSVDAPAKIGVNPWGDDYKHDVAKRHLEYLSGELEPSGWLEADDANRNPYILTVDGHVRLTELEDRDTGSSCAFVAMWFDCSMDEAWERGIKPGIEDSGHSSVRIGKTEFNDMTSDEIIAEIWRPRFLVAVFMLDGDRGCGGIDYEVGFTHGLGLPVILTCRKYAIDKRLVHFDARQYNHIAWTTPEE